MDTDDLKAINDAISDLGVVSKYVDAAVWARVFGGCVVYIGADDGAKGPLLAAPLNEAGIKTLDHINVINRRYAQPHSWYKDPSNPKFGEPETYMITPTGTGAEVDATTAIIHETRLIRFDGLRASSFYRQQNQGWGLSLLQRMNQVLQDYGMSFQGLAHLLSDANQGVFKMEGLIDALAAQETSLIQGRMQLLDMSRSDVRAIVLDKDEDFTRQNFNWSGIKDPFSMMMLRLSSEARIPVTVLMGQSPAGMDATGESDLRWFYDQTEAQREAYLEPKLRDIIRLITLAKDGPTGGNALENYTISFPPLWQPTEKEQAEIYKTNAEGDQIYMDGGVLIPSEVALSRFTPDGYSTEITIDTKTREDMLKNDLEEMLQPPEPPVIQEAPEIPEEEDDE
jgi:phage-related protein (TIGR01555 family)